jgi:hypothetical protein
MSFFPSSSNFEIHGGHFIAGDMHVHSMQVAVGQVGQDNEPPLALEFGPTEESDHRLVGGERNDRQLGSERMIFSGVLPSVVIRILLTASKMLLIERIATCMPGFLVP